MSMVIRATASIFGLGACLTLVAAFQPTKLQQTNIPATSLALTPSEVSQAVQRRMSGKAKIIERLIEGELTLLQAAAWFRWLNETPTEHRCNFRSQWPGNSDGEKLCRQVIGWTQNALRERMAQSQADAVLCRLQGEMDVLMTENGTIELPW